MDKRLFGFLYLRALRTGSRALSLERGSLLDVLLRLQKVRTGLWEETIKVLLILLERVGKAIRNSPRDVMLSHAAKEMGFGWGFGVHEALDQFGALFGPLMVALILAHSGNYRFAFGTLLVPVMLTLILLAIARVLYPRLKTWRWSRVKSRLRACPGYSGFTSPQLHWRRSVLQTFS